MPSRSIVHYNVVPFILLLGVFAVKSYSRNKTVYLDNAAKIYTMQCRTKFNACIESFIMYKQCIKHTSTTHKRHAQHSKSSKKCSSAFQNCRVRTADFNITWKWLATATLIMMLVIVLTSTHLVHISIKRMSNTLATVLKHLLSTVMSYTLQSHIVISKNYQQSLKKLGPNPSEHGLKSDQLLVRIA